MKSFSLFETAILFCASCCFAAGIAALFGAKPAKMETPFQSRILSAVNKPVAFDLGAVHLQLAPRASIRVSQVGSSLKFSEMMGVFEFNVLPGGKVSLHSGAGVFDLASVAGGRVFAEAVDGGLQVQNLSGDILVIDQGRALRLAKRAFVTLTGGRLDVVQMPMPVVLNPRINQRYFTAVPNGEVRVDFMPLKHQGAQIEYVLSDAMNSLVYRGELEADFLKLNLAPGRYQISARVKRGHEYSAWTEPRHFSVWSRPSGIATAF